MGVAAFLVFNKPADFDTFVSGKAIAEAMEDLTKLAAKLKVTSLAEFYGVSAEDLSEMVEDLDLPAEVLANTPATSWFDPKELLTTVRALATQLEKSRRGITGASGVIADLKQYEAVLSRASRKRGMKCYLSIDY